MCFAGQQADMSNRPKRIRPSFSQRVAQEIKGGRSLFSAIFSSSWNSLGSWLNTYDAVDPRNHAMRGLIARPASAADLVTSQPYIRNLCRNKERNNATVRAAVEGLVANIVGTGIDLEPDTGNPENDEKLRAEWIKYKRDCFIDGMCLDEGQTLACREVVVAGEGLWRLVIDPERTKKDKIPLCVLPLESEWLGDSGNTVVGKTEGYVGGIKLDLYGRPLSYSLISPSGEPEPVPADKIIHIFERRRALQIRGEPWLAPILTTLHQEAGLITAELEAAKNTAGYAAAITTAGGLPSDMDEKGSPTRDINIGSVLELQQGEDIKLLSHTRPSQQIKPFRDMLRGDEAGALRIGRRWLDRDISGANYSSMRADMLDNDRLLGPVREWMGHQTAGRLYKAVLPYLCLRAGLELQPDTYRLVPDGQPYVDPLKDAQAAAMAIQFGLSTYEAEIGKRGGDYKAIWKKLAEEKKLMDSLGIVVTTPSGDMFGEEPQGGGEEVTDASKSAGKAKGAGGKFRKEAPMDAETRARLASQDALIQTLLARQPNPQVTLVNETRMDAASAAVMGDAIGKAIPKQDAPTINVAAPTVNVAAPNVTVEQPDAPTINVAAPNVTVAAPSVVIAPAQVDVHNSVVVPSRTIKATPNRDGSVLMVPQDN